MKMKLFAIIFFAGLLGWHRFSHTQAYYHQPKPAPAIGNGDIINTNLDGKMTVDSMIVLTNSPMINYQTISPVLEGKYEYRCITNEFHNSNGISLTVILDFKPAAAVESHALYTSIKIGTNDIPLIFVFSNNLVIYWSTNGVNWETNR